MGKTLYTAIVFFEDKAIVRKYRNIGNINSFINFCKSINASYFNLYYKETKQFAERIYLNEKAPI
jgi:hypothetical protein